MAHEKADADHRIHTLDRLYEQMTALERAIVDVEVSQARMEESDHALTARFSALRGK